MSDTDRSTVDETMTAAQRRQMFEALIGADTDKGKHLWLALDDLICAAQEDRADQADREVARLAKHFPDLARVMLIVWQHVKREDAVSPCRICEPGTA